MPNPTSLLTSFYLVIIATSAGAVYAILTQGGEFLAFIPRYFEKRLQVIKSQRLAVEFEPGMVGPSTLRYPFGFRTFKKLASCGKCVAGQFALWLFFPLIGYPDGLSFSTVLLHFGAVTVSILTSSILILHVGSRS